MHASCEEALPTISQRRKGRQCLGAARRGGGAYERSEVRGSGGRREFGFGLGNDINKSGPPSVVASVASLLDIHTKSSYLDTSLAKMFGDEFGEDDTRFE